jgi:hypothetical protein
MKYLFFLQLLLSLQYLSVAQQQSDTIFFRSGDHHIEHSQYNKIKNIPFKNIRLEGRTDTDGDSEYNLKLSKRRVNMVRKALIEQGHQTTAISSGYFGETKPIDGTHGLQVKPTNRCVIIYYEQATDHTTIAEKSHTPIENQYAFTNSEGIHIELSNGVIIDIEPNSYNTKPETTVNFKVTSYMSKADFILADIHSVAGEELLESAGMFFLQAKADNKNVQLNTQKSVKVQVPNPSKQTDFELFYGQDLPHHTSKRNVNWVHHRVHENRKRGFSNVGSFTVKGYDDKYLINTSSGKRYPTINSWTRKPYKSKWVRIKHNSISSSLKSQKSPVNFQVFVSVNLGKVDSISVTPTVGELNKVCERKLLNVFKIAEWREKKQSIDLVFNFNYGSYIRDDLNNYNLETSDSASVKEASLEMITMSVTQMGWINCDRFYKEKNKKPVYVKTDPTVSVKLVFSKRNSIINGNYSRGRFTFGKIPVDEPYIILAYKKSGNDVLAAERSNKSTEKLTYMKMTRNEFIELLKKY